VIVSANGIQTIRHRARSRTLTRLLKRHPNNAAALMTPTASTAPLAGVCVLDLTRLNSRAACRATAPVSARPLRAQGVIA
jgi:hypothetical protein